MDWVVWSNCIICDHPQYNFIYWCDLWSVRPRKGLQIGKGLILKLQSCCVVLVTIQEGYSEAIFLHSFSMYFFFGSMPFSSWHSLWGTLRATFKTLQRLLSLMHSEWLVDSFKVVLSLWLYLPFEHGSSHTLRRLVCRPVPGWRKKCLWMYSSLCLSFITTHILASIPSVHKDVF